MEPWLARAARIQPDRIALRTADGTNTTYAELHARAAGVAAALLERGVAPGDRVALALPSDELVVALHACLHLGAVAVPVDLRLTEAERAHRTAQATLVLDALPALPATAPAPAPRPIDPDATATLMFTSGTTAGPKPVALSYDNWLWNALGSALALGLDPEERWLCPMPLAHVGGLSIQIRSAVYATTVLLHGRFDTDGVLAAAHGPRRAGHPGLAGARRCCRDCSTPGCAGRRRSGACCSAAAPSPRRCWLARARRTWPWRRPTG